MLAEELMQRTRHHREVGHLGCVIQDPLEKAQGGGKRGEEEEGEEEGEETVLNSACSGPRWAPV